MGALGVNSPPLDGEPFVFVSRGAYVESVHRVAACASDDRGRIQYALGTIEYPVFLRSVAKPFIAAAMVRHGIVERYGLTPAEVATIAGSHNGEPGHVETVRSILEKLGLDESALQCGSHAPYDPASAQALARSGRQPAPIHNNCSGKHAGILALSAVLGADAADYLQPEHPAQRAILEFCARVFDLNFEDLPLAIDGCGIPVFAVPLRNAALGFARLPTGAGLEDRDAAALGTVATAMARHPWHVGGTSEFDSELMAQARGTAIAKSGAEGAFGIALRAPACGIVLKVIDGASRAVPPAAMAILESRGLLERETARALQNFAQPPVYNRSSAVVGRISATDSRHATKRST